MGLKPFMNELLRTNNPVLLSFVEAVLAEAEIAFIVADRNMSVLEGSIGILPRRVLVADDDWAQAMRVLLEAGLDRGELNDERA